MKNKIILFVLALFCASQAQAVTIFGFGTASIVFDTLAITNNLTVGGTLNVTGGTTLDALTAGAVSATSFAGAGTGLSGTAAALSIGGTAALATAIAGGSANKIPYQSAAGVTVFVSSATANSVLFGAANTAPVWSATPSISIGGTAALATSLAGGDVNKLPLQSAAGVTAFISSPTANGVLFGAANTAPVWSNTPTFLGTNVTAIPAANINAGALGAGAYTDVGSIALSTSATSGYALKFMGAKTLAELAATIPGAAGEVYFVVNGSVDTLAISTQAVTANWQGNTESRASGGTNAH
jgi:hypothetical protein